MQTPFPDHSNPATFFSRERRRQRMLQFLEAFERRSWSGNLEAPYLLPFADEHRRDSGLVGSNEPAP